MKNMKTQKQPAVQIGEWAELLQPRISFAKPDYFDDLVAKYRAILEPRLSGSHFVYRTQITQITTAEDTSDNEEDMCANDSAAMDGDDEGVGSLQDQFTKNKEAKIAVKLNPDRNLFLHFKEYRDDWRIAPKPYMYAIDLTDYNHRISNSKKYNGIVVSISGGVVVPNPEPMCKSIPSDLPDREPILINTSDFESLYPTVMIFANLCLSSTAYNAKYCVGVWSRGRMYNPFDDDVFNLVPTPIKFNDSFLSVLTIIIKPTVQQSVISALIENIKRIRKETKVKLAVAKKKGDTVAAASHHFLQLALKLTINTMYGILKRNGYVTFRPCMAALITYFGRMQLVRFFLSIFYSLSRANIDQRLRGPVGGDTDSIFFKCTLSEMRAGIETFCSWPSNRGVFRIELESSMEHIFFLCKKNYISHRSTPNGPEYICKGAMKSSQSGPCRVLCVSILEALFELFLREPRDIEALRASLTQAFDAFNNSKDHFFKHKFKLKRDLDTYLQPNRVLKQLKMVGRPFFGGSDIEFSHYPFIFDEGPFYGPIGNNVGRMRYALRDINRQCTALVSELYEIKYREEFDRMGIRVARTRTFELDLKSVFDKIFGCLDQSTSVQGGGEFLAHFKDIYQNTFGVEYFTKDEIAARPKAKAQKTPASASVLPASVVKKHQEAFEAAIVCSKRKLAADRTRPPKQLKRDIASYFKKS